MSGIWTRIRTLMAQEMGFHFRGLLFWAWAGFLILLSFIASDGSMALLGSGDSATGGKTAFVTSEYSVSLLLPMFTVIISTFLHSIVAGLSVIRDDEARVGEILNATRLRPGQYIWGKFLGALSVTLLVLVIQVVAMMVCNHLVPHEEAKEVIGPFVLMNYVRPALFLVLPYLILCGGGAFLLGATLRQPIAVFAFPFAMMIVTLITISHGNGDVSRETSQFYQKLDPSGMLWMQATYTEVDRGATFYNTVPVVYDAPFLLSRLVHVLLGLSLVGIAHLYRARTLLSPSRIAPSPVTAKPSWALTSDENPWAAPVQRVTPPRSAPLSALRMSSGQPDLWQGALAVARAEVRELLRQPGLYLFLTLILFYALVNQSDKTGMFGTSLLLTPGMLASMERMTVTVSIALLILFYAVETLERDKNTGFSAIQYATPIRTASILLGKGLALNIIGLSVTAIVLFIALINIALQHRGVPISLTPFALLWGLLTFPALACWTLFLVAVYAFTGHNRYITYAIGLNAIAYLTTAPQLLTYVSNLFLAGSVEWSDLSVLEADRPALILSRLFVLTLAGLYAVYAARKFRRREPDIAAATGRMKPLIQLRLAVPLIPFLVVAIGLGITLRHLIDIGPEGKGEEKRQKNYWKQNVETYRNFNTPGVSGVDVAVDLRPEQSAFSAKGTMTLVNNTDEPIRRIPLTAGFFWKKLKWTMMGKAYKPEDRSGLYVFTPPLPLKRGETIDIGFSYDAPDNGVSKNGGNGMEFVLPSAIVLTSFSPSFVPLVGFVDGIGIDEDNQSDPPVADVDAYKKKLRPLFGSSALIDLKIAITAPVDYTVHSSGTRVTDTVKNGRHRVVYVAKADPKSPVRDFNIIGGKNLIVKKGKRGTAIYYYPGHSYNVEEMSLALDSARHSYGVWFAPFPYPELRLTEFPGLVGYAQSFPGNITFSESMGFLVRVRPKDKLNDAFAVTAHEAAHQWWGNLVTPGDGPGGNVLSEGLAHYSTTLLIAHVKGDEARQDFLEKIERSYNQQRSVDSELPLSELTGRKEGDVTATYDRGGWVFYMMREKMGNDAMQKGLRAFIAKYRDTDDHPLLEDFVATLRPFARDAKTSDDFCDQWLYDTTVPQFKITNPKRTMKKITKPAKKKKGKPTQSEEWTTTFDLANTGTGSDIPLKVELRDENGTHNPESAGDFLLSAGKKPLHCTLHSTFKPVWIVTDPDVKVLQTGRDASFYKFKE